MIAFSSASFGQVAIPLSQLQRKIPDRNVSYKVLDDYLFVASFEHSWIVSKDGRRSKDVPNIKGVWGVQKCDTRLLVEIFTVPPNPENDDLPPRELWLLSQSGEQATKVEGITVQDFSCATFEDNIFVISEGDIWLISANGTRARHVEGMEGNAFDFTKIGEELFVTASKSLWKIGKGTTRATRVGPDTFRPGNDVNIALWDNQLFVGSVN